MAGRKKYAIVGTGSRHRMYRNAILGKQSQAAELVGLCDINPQRLALARAEAMTIEDTDVQAFDADQFDEMLRQTKPDCLIVTVPDCYHDDYVKRAMAAGIDVMTEKPMTTTAEKCQGIIDAQKKTGRDLRVTFNYRYSPPRTQVKDLLMSGVIGEVLTVEFHWLLNTRHGADYFRRWHRNKENSGGLLVHKATHHFDLVNWWLSDVPVSVYAEGDRQFYLPETAERLGLTERSDRCHTCPQGDGCDFALKLQDNEHLKKLYLDCEDADGYFRDKCVFSEDIDIEDRMSVVADYARGARLTYSLHAFSPWEGYTIAFNGTLGRIEHKSEETVYTLGDGSVPGQLKPEGTWTRVYPLRARPYEVEVWQAEGAHGGADPVMLDYLFNKAAQPEDKYLRAADWRSGAYSILTGVAANEAIRTGERITIADLVLDIPLPDYPAMPGM